MYEPSRAYACEEIFFFMMKTFFLYTMQYAYIQFYTVFAYCTKYVLVNEWGLSVI